MGTKPAKAGCLAPCLLNQGSNPGNTRVYLKISRLYPGIWLFWAVFAKRSSLGGRTKVAKVGPPRARVKSAKVRPTPYVYYPRVVKSLQHMRHARAGVKNSRHKSRQL